MTHYKYITMVMQTLQIRLTTGLIKYADTQVKSGLYANRSDVIRDALRKQAWHDYIGTVQLKKEYRGLSAEKAVKKARTELDEELLSKGFEIIKTKK